MQRERVDDEKEGIVVVGLALTTICRAQVRLLLGNDMVM